MFKTETIAAGVGTDFQEAGDFLRLMDDGGVPWDVDFYSQGKLIARAEGVRSGYAERLLKGPGYDKVRVTNKGGVTAACTFVMRLGNEVRYDSPPTGQVNVAPGTFTQGAVTVTSASSQIAAANGKRGYLLVQNKDTSGTIYVNVTGVAATTANGVMIEPGASWEITGRCPTAAVTAIGDAASNTNIVIVES